MKTLSFVMTTIFLTLSSNCLLAEYTLFEYGRDCAKAMGVEFPKLNCQDPKSTLLPVTRTEWERGHWKTVDIKEGQPFSLKDRAADRPALLEANAAAFPGDRILKVVQVNKNGEQIITVLNCRRKRITSAKDPKYEDVAVIQHNTSTNKVCWFNSRITESLDSTDLPLPWTRSRMREDQEDKKAKKYWTDPITLAQAPNYLRCYQCHNGSLWIRTPFVKQAESDKRPGVDNTLPDSEFVKKVFHVGEAFKLWNDPKHKPFPIEIDEASYDARFPPTDRVPRAPSNTCTQCHVLGRNQRLTNDPEKASLEGEFSGGCGHFAWDALGQKRNDETNQGSNYYSRFGKTFPHSRWMPPGKAEEFAKKYGPSLGKQKFDEYYERAKKALRFCCSEADLSKLEDRKICLGEGPISPSGVQKQVVGH